MALSAAQRSAAAEAIVRDFAPGAPEAVRVAAVDMVSRSIEHDPLTERVEFADETLAYHNMGASIIRRCGAASILAPWRRPRARALTVEAST